LKVVEVLRNNKTVSEVVEDDSQVSGVTRDHSQVSVVIEGNSQNNSQVPEVVKDVCRVFESRSCSYEQRELGQRSSYGQLSVYDSSNHERSNVESRTFRHEQRELGQRSSYGQLSSRIVGTTKIIIKSLMRI
jgi:hypothetical protein